MRRNLVGKLGTHAPERDKPPKSPLLSLEKKETGLIPAIVDISWGFGVPLPESTTAVAAISHFPARSVLRAIQTAFSCWEIRCFVKFSNDRRSGVQP